MVAFFVAGVTLCVVAVAFFATQQNHPSRLGFEKAWKFSATLFLSQNMSNKENSHDYQFYTDFLETLAF
jgi:sugar phosphate permease